ncbi:MAG: DNA polymerase I [Clostridia bacterium]|nr:DNA polymerase I [Clostridia bacterium]
MRRLLAVDGNSIMNRAFYGVHQGLTNREGFPTNALFGMLNMLTRLQSEYRFDACVAAFDVHKPTFRHQIYDQYKAGRHETPHELVLQFPVCHEILRAMGYTVLEKEGYEADDILGTVAALGSRAGDVHTYIYTGDRDSLQLISDSCTVLLVTNSGIVPYTPDKFIAEKGITPAQYVDVKAIMGDPSDNIPGVPGVGEKKAFPLIAQYGSLKALYEALPDQTEIKGSLLNKLLEGQESAFYSRDLAQIETKVPLDTTAEDLFSASPDPRALRELLEKYDFVSFLKKMNLSAPLPEEGENNSDPAVHSSRFQTVEGSVKELKNVSNDTIIAVSEDETHFYAAYGDTCLKIRKDPSEIKDFLLSGRPFVIYDCKEYYHAKEREGIRFRGAFFDPMLAAYVIDSNAGHYALGELCEKYLKTEKAPGIPDACYALLLYEALLPLLEESRQLKLLKDIEMPLAQVLCDMEETGFRIDRESIASFAEKLRRDEATLEEECHMLAGMDFNLNSPKQLGEVLFEVMGLPCEKKTKKGYSTSADVLEKLRPYSPIIEKILDYRTISKLRATYADGLLKVADEKGRVHTTFRQTGTATGRLSSAEPNLQNIPIRSELGREFRKFFVPLEDGRVLIDADYSQIELRLLANISGDENMISAFNSDADIHTATASKVFGVPPEAVTPELRKRAKAVNFGILYGIGPHSLSQDLHVSMAQAKAFIENYKRTYPQMAQYLSDVVRDATEKGYTETLFGRRRYIPELQQENKILKGFGERVAMNSPIQGSAADLIKIAMIRVSTRLSESTLDAELILQVHDELILDASEKDAEAAMSILKEEMESVLDLPVRCVVEAAIGKSWYDCH